MVDGVVIPVSNCSCVTIDFWGQTNRNILAAFLTHAHADHIQGLKDSWNGEKDPPNLHFVCDVTLQGWSSYRL